MIVLDSTILVYATGADHPLRDPCLRIVDAIGDRRIVATTTVGVIQEVSHVRSRRRPRADVVRLLRPYVGLLAPLLRPDEHDLRRAFELFVDHPRLGAFDAVLAATVLNGDHLTALVSADRAFADVPGLVHLDPADPAVLA